MALLKIAKLGHPVLRIRAAEVADPTDPEVRRLVADIVETMADAGGIGLAAPQVHVPQRVIVFWVPEERRGADDPPAPEGVQAVINPAWEPAGDEIEEALEGCLSIPGIRGAVPRHHRIRYRGTSPDGSAVEVEAVGIHARVVQHEIDHLNGVVFLDRMPDMQTLGFEDELDKLADK